MQCDSGSDSDMRCDSSGDSGYALVDRGRLGLTAMSGPLSMSLTVVSHVVNTAGSILRRLYKSPIGI